MFKCINQQCGARWTMADVIVKNEGQGLMFRCPTCGARNKVVRRDSADGAIVFEQEVDK